jgi:3D (Asp-Asp-Asp) domain-containing protein
MLITLCFIVGLFSLQSSIVQTGNQKVNSPTRENKIALVQKSSLPVTMVTNQESAVTKQNTNATSIVNQTDSAVKEEPQQVAQASRTIERSDNTVSRGATRTLSMVATGYTDAPEENYPYAGQPSYIGLPLARGIVAVDPNVIPMGTKLYIEGYGEAIAADQGGAIKGNRIDLFFDSKSEANSWGMKTVRVTVYR